MNQIVYGSKESERPITARLWRLMWAEFKRNGNKCLTRGKMRYLRRQVRRTRLPLTGSEIEAARLYRINEAASRRRQSSKPEVICLDP